MNLTKPFVEILKQKLSVGSSRSILLNAIPGKLLTRLPITDLEVIKQGLGKEFLEILTSQNSFNFKFAVELQDRDEENLKKLARTGKRLSAIKYDYDDYVKEHGIETFGFGFPILIHKNPKDASKYLAAPIFIFQLNIEQSFGKNREWIISRNIDSEIRCNEVLYSFIEGEEHIKLPTIPEEMLEDGLLDKTEIEKFCSDLLLKFSGSSALNPKWEKLENLPEKLNATDPTLKQTRIAWNGILGLYRSPKQNLLKEMEPLLANFDSLIGEDESSFEWEQSHSPMTTDPSQNGVLRSLGDNKNIVIQGPPGTGKSQTLTAIVSSALANKKKVLVVCEKRTALEVLKNNLETLIPNISQSIALIEDVARDRTTIVQTVRNRTAKFLIQQHQLQSTLREDIKRFEFKAEQIEKQYQALKKPIWRNMDWPSLVAKWISLEKSESDIIDLYNFQKKFRELQLSDENYFSLSSIVEDATAVFSKIQSKYNQIDEQFLTPPVINNDYSREIIFTVKDILSTLSNVKKDIENIINNFQSETSKYVHSSIENTCKQLTELIYILNLHNNIDVFKISNIVKLKAIFFKKYKIVVQHSNQATSILNSLNIFWIENFQQPFELTDLQNKIMFLQNTSSELATKKANDFLENTIPNNKIKNLNFNDWETIISTVKKSQESYASIIKYKIPQAQGLTMVKLLYVVNNIYQYLEKILVMESDLKYFFSWKIFESKLNKKKKNGLIY